jgi:hypothetical protein
MSKKRSPELSQRQRKRLRLQQILFTIVAIVVITTFIIGLITTY